MGQSPATPMTIKAATTAAGTAQRLEIKLTKNQTKTTGPMTLGASTKLVTGIRQMLINTPASMALDSDKGIRSTH